MTDTIEEQKLKRCTKCGELKPLSEYHASKRSKDGKRSVCKSCRKKYTQDNKEYYKEYRHQNYIKNRADVLLNVTEYYEKNRKEILSKKHDYYLAHKDEKAAYDSKYREENKEIRKIIRDIYYKNNKVIINKKSSIFQKTPKGKLISANTRHRRRMQKEATPEQYHITKEQWDNIIESQNNKCAICGQKFTDKLKPNMDHIVPLSKGGEHTSTNIQALCKSCNCSKHANISKEYIQTWIYGVESC